MNHRPTTEVFFFGLFFGGFGRFLVAGFFWGLGGFFVFLSIHLENPRAWAASPSNEHGKLCRGCSCSGIPAQLSAQLPPKVLGWGHCSWCHPRVRTRPPPPGTAGCGMGWGPPVPCGDVPQGGALSPACGDTAGDTAGTSPRHPQRQAPPAPGAVPVGLIPALGARLHFHPLRVNKCKAN